MKMAPKTIFQKHEFSNFMLFRIDLIKEKRISPLFAIKNFYGNQLLRDILKNSQLIFGKMVAPNRFAKSFGLFQIFKDIFNPDMGKKRRISPLLAIKDVYGNQLF